MRAFVLTGAAASVILWFNYDASMAKVFTFLSVLVTASNLPVYLAGSLGVLVLWRRREIGRVGRREVLWIAAAPLAAAYCIWAFAGAGAKPVLLGLVLAALGIPFHLWATWVRRNTLASGQPEKSTVTG
jgi:APA family basic amino acid/polyamine antiporter